MNKRYSSKDIRDYIINNVEDNPNSINRMAADKFDISRQSIHRHLINLINKGIIKAEGNTRNRHYSLKSIIDECFYLNVDSHLEEDVVWRQNIRPLLKSIKANIVEICQYGFTEILNNVVDHSESTSASVSITIFINKISLCVIDEGVGIFNKISRSLNLEDERHAVLELTKGKLTTDKAHHTGEGIFFTSRMFDRFSILSGSLYYLHRQGKEEDWLLQDEDKPSNGTVITMSISTNSSRTTKDVFDKYTSTGDDFNFTRTHVPVALARYGEEQLVSRSQAKRLLARLEPFKEVFLNFEGVDFIGQAFADEIFRVFKNDHPDIEIVWINASKDVENMIKRVIKGSADDNQLKLKM